jgi:hypothetical protein
LIKFARVILVTVMSHVAFSEDLNKMTNIIKHLFWRTFIIHSLVPVGTYIMWNKYTVTTYGKTLITRYQASREPHDITSAQLLIVVWKMSTFSEERFVTSGITFTCAISGNPH